MAIRNIVKDTDGYDTLHKKCRPVTDFNQKLWDLLDDMAQTMYKAQGVGLAGPQVGMLRRVFVIDVGEGILEFVNPEILETSGHAGGSRRLPFFPRRIRHGGKTKPCQGARTEPHGRMV